MAKFHGNYTKMEICNKNGRRKHRQKEWKTKRDVKCKERKQKKQHPKQQSQQIKKKKHTAI